MVAVIRSVVPASDVNITPEMEAVLYGSRRVIASAKSKTPSAGKGTKKRRGRPKGSVNKRKIGRDSKETLEGIRTAEQAATYTRGKFTGVSRVPVDDDLFNYGRTWYRQGRWSDVIVPYR